MGNIDKIKSTIKGWRLGDYFRQFSIVAAGIIVTFWGSDRITEYSRQKEVRAAMQLVAEELEYNRKELRNIKHLLDIDRNMSSLLIKHKMDISGIPRDTLTKYDKLFNNMNELSYRTDALDVLKGSSLMQYISDKRLLHVLRSSPVVQSASAMQIFVCDFSRAGLPQKVHNFYCYFSHPAGLNVPAA